jgi:hypothetical protein
MVRVDKVSMRGEPVGWLAFEVMSRTGASTTERLPGDGTNQASAGGE